MMKAVTSTAIAGVVALSTALAGTQTASAYQDRYERWFYVSNYGHADIWSVYATPIDDRSFGFDLLGPYVIPAGQSMVLEPDYHLGYCRFDILIEYTDGSEFVIWDVNLCEATEVATNGDRWQVFY